MVAPRLFIIATLFVLVACKQESSQPNEAIYRYYGAWYNYETPLGIRYRDDTEAPERGPTLEEIDSWYTAVNECVGVWIDPKSVELLVIRTDDIPADQEDGHYWTPGLIAFLPREQLPMERMTFKHEVLHLLLWRFVGDASSHDSPLFQECAR